MVPESGLLQEPAERYALAGPLLPLAIPATLHDSLRDAAAAARWGRGKPPAGGWGSAPAGAAPKGRILLANLLQRSRRTFSLPVNFSVMRLDKT
jgi:hypothetical protein